MVNYQNGKIYTIRCRSDDTLIYVGSTSQTLSQRMTQHRCGCKRSAGCSFYKYIIDNNWDEWYIELYEMYPCNSKEELGKREGEVIRQIATINKKISGRTQKEYYEEHAEKLKEYQNTYRVVNTDKVKEHKKEYSKKNAEKISEKKKEKVCCDICGTFIRKDGLTRHKKSKSCLDIASKK